MTSARFALKKRSTDRKRSVDSHPRFSAPIVRANTRHSSRASGGMLAASSLERFRFAGARVGGVVTAAATRGGADELASPRPRAAPRSGTKKHRDDDDVFDDARKRPRDVTTADAPSTPPQPSTKPPPPSPLSQASVARTPFIAPSPARWRERYAPTCEACERDRKHCAHHAEVPLKLLIIGHNPSDHSWESGYSYSNPSNNMWKLLVRGEIIPSAWTSDDCPRLAGELGIGFTDAGTEPGNDANAYGRAVMKEWREDLYARLRGHLCRASGRAIGGEEGDVADEIDDAAKTWRATAAAFGPSVVAFAGKRQYAQLFDTIPKRVEVGKQPPGSLPPRWPFCEDATEVWVLPSSSGRAAMTREARETPYLELGARLAEVEWPRRDGGFRGGAERRREPMKVLLRYDR